MNRARWAPPGLRRAMRPVAVPWKGLAAGLGRLAAASLLCLRAGPWMYLGLLAVTVVTGLLPAGTAWSTKAVLDSVASGRPAASALWWAAALVAIGLVTAVVPNLSAYMDTELVRRVDRHVQDRLYSAVSSFSGLARFEDPRFLDRLRMASLATGSALTPATTGLFDVGRSVLTLLSLLVTLYVLSPVMAVVLVGAAFPALMAQILLSRQQVGMMMVLSPANRRYLFYKSLITDVRAAKEVRLFSLQSFLRERLLGTLTRIQDGERRLDKRTALVQAVLALAGGVIAGAGLLWAVRAASHGRLSVGDVSAFAAAVAGVQAALAALVSGIGAAHQALLSLGHHLEVVGAPDDFPDPPAGSRLTPLRSGLELRDVWFRYDDAHPWILRGVSLTVPAGASVALVGLNGAGKSTLIKLLCRFYDPTRGAILWDGVDIRQVPVAELRRRIGALFQDFMTYDLTAAENIGVGDPPALRERPRIERAARIAGVHEQIQAMPRGYDTLLSRAFQAEDGDDPEAGVVLSGGQWQRVALARALLRDDHDLLILDEPSAGLDAEAEHRMHRRLGEHRAGRTTLLVSHRLNVVREADLIVALADGRIAEQGTHAHLCRADGLYARLFALQAEGYGDATFPNPENDNGRSALLGTFDGKEESHDQRHRAAR
ncbi:ABC transporter ATP-binding protein [Actinomadura madurae]|uniref:ABC transporter ATP-binding protein n=1 Tax=Actinomadura madurae TaxID=1993 RepID=UPI00399A34DC